MVQKVCVSLSDVHIRYINRQEGISFSEKLRRIIDRDRAHEDLSADSRKSDFDISDNPEQLSILFEE